MVVLLFRLCGLIAVVFSHRVIACLSQIAVSQPHRADDAQGDRYNSLVQNASVPVPVFHKAYDILRKALYSSLHSNSLLHR